VDSEPYVKSEDFDELRIPNNKCLMATYLEEKFENVSRFFNMHESYGEYHNNITEELSNVTISDKATAELIDQSVDGLQNEIEKYVIQKYFK